MSAFSLLIGLAASLGLGWTAWRAKNSPRQILDAGLWSLLGALLGGRLVYSAFNCGYYQANPLEIIQVFRGGLSWFGALAGGLIALAVFAAIAKQSLPRLADALLPMIAALTTAAWLGAWLTGSAFGLASAGWWALPALDEWGALTPRLPVPLLGELAAILLLWLVDANRDRWRVPGQAACLWLLGFALSFFALTYLRADPMPVSFGLRLDAWAALLTAALSLLGLVYLSRSQSLSLTQHATRT